MGRGSYLGGSTIVGPWSSGWFSNGKNAPNKPTRKAKKKANKLTPKQQEETAKKAADKRDNAARHQAREAAAKRKKLEQAKKAPIARAAREKAEQRARKIVPRVPNPGETVFITNKRVKVAPKVELKLRSGERVQIKVATRGAERPRQE